MGHIKAVVHNIDKVVSYAENAFCLTIYIYCYVLGR